MGELPRLVEVPKDLSMDKVEQAITICMRLGLLTPGPGGWWLLPEAMNHDLSKCVQFRALRGPAPRESR